MTKNRIFIIMLLAGIFSFVACFIVEYNKFEKIYTSISLAMMIISILGLYGNEFLEFKRRKLKPWLVNNFYLFVAGILMIFVNNTDAGLGYRILKIAFGLLLVILSIGYKNEAKADR